MNSTRITRNVPQLTTWCALLTLAIVLLGVVGCDDETNTTDQPDATDLSETGDTDTDATEPIQLASWCGTSTIDVPGDPAPGCDAGETDPTDCPEGERGVCGLGCVKDYDRICKNDSHCRADEQCRLLESNHVSGTCVWTGYDTTCCPGGPGCEEPGDEGISVGFGAVDMTPPAWELPRPEFMDGHNFTGDHQDPDTFCDCGTDGICPDTEEFEECPDFGEYTGPDANGTEQDGYMQSMWIAGFGNNRVALLCDEDRVSESCEGPDCCTSRQAHDPVWARTIVLEQGETRVAWVTLDLVGFFYDDMRAIEDGLSEELDVDYLLVSSTHTHEAPDGMGQWGPADGLPVATGLTEQWKDIIFESVTQSVEEAVADIQEADIYAANVDTGVEGVAFRDSREPYIIDDRMTMVAFTKPGMQPFDEGGTLGTIVNWHNHPEALGGDNSYITSDFSHYIRKYTEEGLPAVDGEDGEKPAIAGLGGTSIYVSGIVGGLTTPLGVEAVDRAGNSYVEDSFAKADAMGQTLAEMALVALRDDAEQIEEDTLTVRSRSFLLPVSNLLLTQALQTLGVLNRGVYNMRQLDSGTEGYYPHVRTAVTRFTIGELSIQGIPGEIFPELSVGFGQGTALANPWLGDPTKTECGASMLPDTEGSERCIISPGNEYPPAIEDAPTDGFLREIVPGEYQVLAGLTDDELGYLVPSYDYKVNEVVPGLVEAPGDHYEETNSVSDSVGTILEMIESLY